MSMVVCICLQKEKEKSLYIKPSSNIAAIEKNSRISFPTLHWQTIQSLEFSYTNTVWPEAYASPIPSSIVPSTIAFRTLTVSASQALHKTIAGVGSFRLYEIFIAAVMMLYRPNSSATSWPAISSSISAIKAPWHVPAMPLTPSPREKIIRISILSYGVVAAAEASGALFMYVWTARTPFEVLSVSARREFSIEAGWSVSESVGISFQSGSLAIVRHHGWFKSWESSWGMIATCGLFRFGMDTFEMTWQAGQILGDVVGS